MIAPNYDAAVLVPHAVLEEEAKIIQLEGFFHVRSIYFAFAFDADRARRAEAERRVRDRGEHPQ